VTALATEAAFGPSGVPSRWVGIDAAAAVLAATMLAYLDQLAVSMRPSTVRAGEGDLRVFAEFLFRHDPALTCVGDVERSRVEAFKIWFRSSPATSRNETSRYQSSSTTATTRSSCGPSPPNQC
jgi:hypothetical protein